MRQDRREIDDAGGLVDRGGLHGRDLMLAEGLAYDLETTRQRGIAERALVLPRAIWPDRCDQRFLRIDQFRLCIRSAAARQAIDSLDRCTAALLDVEVETHGARF